MIVCPNCRHANDEELRSCVRCGATLEPGSTALAPRRPADPARPPLEIATPKPPSKARPFVVLGVLVLAVAAGVVLWLVRPDPCAGTNFSSDNFGYCLAVPDGWTAEPARFGADVTLDQFAPPSESATVVVEAVDLAQGADLSQWSAFVQKKDTDAGLTPGPTGDATVDGVTARRWDVTVTADDGTAYRMREVVLVRGEVGWRITLNDTEQGFEVSAATFAQMLGSWHFT